jgi:hypothetical protein
MITGTVVVISNYIGGQLAVATSTYTNYDPALGTNNEPFTLPTPSVSSSGGVGSQVV